MHDRGDARPTRHARPGARGPRPARHARGAVPGEAIPVFAHWYTGTLRAWEGELVEHEHMPYESVYERTRLIDVVEGRVTGERLDEPSPGELRRQRMEELLRTVKERQA